MGAALAAGACGMTCNALAPIPCRGSGPASWEACVLYFLDRHALSDFTILVFISIAIAPVGILLQSAANVWKQCHY